MTALAVDLVAVARARTELAALVAAHPELTHPAAQQRLADALPEIHMPPRLDPTTTDDTTIVGVRMTPEMLRALDAEVARQRATNPDVSIGRSNVLRGIIRRALLTAPGASPEPAPIIATASPADNDTKPQKAPQKAPRKVENTNPQQAPKAARGVPSQLALIDTPPSDGMDDQADLRARLIAGRHNEESNKVPKGERQWSVRSIATRYGVSSSTVQALIQGGRIAPESAAKLAPALNE